MFEISLALARLGEIKIMSFRLITLVAAAGIILISWYFNIPRFVNKISNNDAGARA